MKLNRPLSQRRFSLAMTVAMLLALLSGPAAPVAISQNSSSDQAARIRAACKSLGFELTETSFLDLTPMLIGGITSADSRESTTLFIFMYDSLAQMQSSASGKDLLQRDNNLDLGTQWAHVGVSHLRFEGGGGSTGGWAAQGEASVSFTCGNAILMVKNTRAGDHPIDDTAANEAAGAKLAEVAKPAAIEMARRLLTALAEQGACEAKLAASTSGVVFSIPKNRETYIYSSPLPFLKPSRNDGASFSKLYGARSGDFELVLSYKDRQGKTQSESFRKSMAQMMPSDSQQAKQWKEEGERRRHWLGKPGVVRPGFRRAACGAVPVPPPSQVRREPGASPCWLCCRSCRAALRASCR